MVSTQFVKNVLVDKLNVKLVIMGENSTFGKEGLGDINLMRRLGEQYGFRVECIDLLCEENGEVISSTKIRAGTC